MSQGQNLSYIESHEVDEAEKYVLERMAIASGITDIKPFHPTGYHMAVLLYTREEDTHEAKDKDGNLILDPDGNPIVLYLPSSVKANEKWTSCTALVVAQGPECYQGHRFMRSGPWCRVGDWVIIPRNEGTQINYRGLPMQIIPDDRVIGVVEDPSHVTKD